MQTSEPDGPDDRQRLDSGRRHCPDSSASSSWVFCVLHTYSDEPPIPETINAPDGSVLFTRADIRRTAKSS